MVEEGVGEKGNWGGSAKISNARRTEFKGVVGDKPIKQAILAAPFYKMIGNEYFDNLNKTFIEHPFDWGKIKGKAKQFVVLAGDNDPYVPVEQTKFIAEKLGADFKLIKNGGHLNASAGFLKFEEVLREIVLLI